LFAVDSFSLPARSLTIAVSGSLQNVNGVSAIGVQPETVSGGTSVIGTIRMLHPVKRASAGLVTLSSSHPSVVAVPTTVTVPLGATSATFNIATTSVAADTTVTLTASSGIASQSTSLTLLSGISALTQITFDDDSVDGGTSINGTAILGAPAPPGGAEISLSSSDVQVATVSPVVIVPEGATSVAFTITTYKLNATSQVTITGFYGATVSRPATIAACTELTHVEPPSSISLDATWFDDSLPAGATPSGNGIIDTTQAGSGSSAIHLSGAAAAERTFAFTTTTPFNIGPDDRLVLYALINPCDPPSQLLVGWKSGPTQYRASWGQSRIEAATAHTIAGPLPRGGEWVRLEVLAKSLGVAGNVSISDFSVRTLGGEAWVDSVGKSACVVTTASAPELNPNEIVWFDDDLPAGAVGDAPFRDWDTSQSATGSRSHLEPLMNDWHEHSFDRATDKLAVGRGDLLFTYVYLDPCNPPKQVMLDWFDGTSWDHRAYWGDSRINDGSEGSAGRIRMGPLPELGKWVRLEAPAALVNMEGRAASGASFVLFDGQAWFDRTGRIPRINVARGKTAKQSSTLGNSPANAAANLVDGLMDNLNQTNNSAQPYWEVDLGAKMPIESVQIHNRIDCCGEKLSTFWVLISDAPLPADLAGAKAAATIALRHVSWSDVPFLNVNASGQHVRIQLEGQNVLHLREVEVWAPATIARENLAIGKTATQSSPNGTNTIAAQAVDGLLNANHQLTASELRPWWQVDLGALHDISSISIFKRTDCCAGRLDNFYLLVSDDPMTGTLDQILQQANVRAYYYASIPMSAAARIDQRGRYVRIQLNGTSFLNINEVQVWGQQPTLMPLSRPAATVGR
jgi:hypothetical protein